MTRNRTFALACLAAAALIAVGGCAKEDEITYARSPEADDAAQDAFDRGANRPATPKTLFALSRVLAAQGRDAECEAVLFRVIRLDKAFLPAYCDLAEARVRTGRVEAAIAALNAGLEVAPQDPVLTNNLGMCFMLQNKYDDALACFTRAAAAVPDKARYRANMAAALGMLGREPEAAALYFQVLDPQDACHNLSVLRGAREPEPQSPTRE